MQPHLSHPAFHAAFCSSEQKALLCDCDGVILAASDSLIQHSLNIIDDVVGQPFRIYSTQFDDKKPWFKNLSSHHRDTRIYGAADIESVGELHQLNIITVTPLQLGNTLSGFKITLEDDSLFEKSLPTAAWHQLFDESHDGMCLFDETFRVLSANTAFRKATYSEETSGEKISEVLAVENDFKHWFLNATLLSSEASLTKAPNPKTAFISITPIDLGGQQVFWLTLKEANLAANSKQKLSQSFQRFRALFDDNLNGIALVSAQGTIIEANRQLCQLLQYNSHDVIGKPGQFFNAPGSYELSAQDGEIFMKSGFVKPFEKTLQKRDGQTVQVVVQLFPNYSAAGEYTGAWHFISVLDDDHQQLIKNAHYYENLFLEGRDAMVLTDLAGHIKLTNRAFCQLVRSDNETLQKQNLGELTVADDYQLEQNLYHPQLLDQGYSDIYEKRYIASDGEELPVSVRNIIVRNHAGKPEAIWSVARDASIRRKLIESLAVSERRFRSLFSSSFDAIGLWTNDNQLQYANKAFLDLVGYSQEEVRHLTYLDFTPQQWQATDEKMAKQVAARGYSDVFEKEVITKDGKCIPISIRASAMQDNDENLIGSWVIIRDISEFKETLRKLQHSQNLLQQTSRMSRVGGWELSAESKTFTLTNETFQILSIPRSYHTTVKNIAKLLDSNSETAIFKAVSRVYRGRGPMTTELQLTGFSPERWIRVSAQLAYEPSGQRYVYGAVQDISDFKQQQRSLESARDTFQQMAFHDPLTNLPNRLLLEDRFQQISNQAKRDHKMVALMIIDLDDFKAVNDIHGHPAGDALLVQIAQRLSQTIRSSDTVARLGGDEFVIIARLDDQGQAESLAQKIIRNIEKPTHWEQVDLVSGCSIGIAISKQHQTSFESLYAKADQALYRVKELGKGAYDIAQPLD